MAGISLINVRNMPESENIPGMHVHYIEFDQPGWMSPNAAHRNRLNPE